MGSFFHICTISSFLICMGTFVSHLYGYFFSRLYGSFLSSVWNFFLVCICHASQSESTVQKNPVKKWYQEEIKDSRVSQSFNVYYLVTMFTIQAPICVDFIIHMMFGRRHKQIVFILWLFLDKYIGNVWWHCNKKITVVDL